MSYSYERFFNPDCDVEGKPSEDENEDEMTAFDELELKKMQEFMANESDAVGEEEKEEEGGGAEEQEGPNTVEGVEETLDSMAELLHRSTITDVMRTLNLALRKLQSEDHVPGDDEKEGKDDSSTTDPPCDDREFGIVVRALRSVRRMCGVRLKNIEEDIISRIEAIRRNKRNIVPPLPNDEEDEASSADLQEFLDEEELVRPAWPGIDARLIPDQYRDDIRNSCSGEMLLHSMHSTRTFRTAT
ncbi:hypothetical protein M951_chr3171 (nucleomorph) [Lotharella oceanica]|uniref:Uncharacterized protein n=1 Tax=Lotharella oceanica TaxID=641309 RepID=A0A060DH92_9EUKA|nr:hypothetical protein M951_chr134 [Lotharella oceanica]AIB09676.1 hypothetical protein M951_chr1197 [Lotharella oceanica]AIB09737.1 hypothetical protein M951_chr234 [Lotharella oceanica]AIB09879.1 hypothetical protein M951_chr2187 [Lotharella oceanica]AIB09940.1 hypothetical protein M951_chr334 [Lotharella oceanica]